MCELKTRSGALGETLAGHARFARFLKHYL